MMKIALPSSYLHLRFARYLLPLLLCLVVVAPLAAQPLPPAPTARHLNRTAPAREPVLLRTALRADPVNRVNTTVNTVIQLPAIADTYIASERPNENFGGDALFLGYNFFGDRFGAQRLLVRFNVDSIPPNARINSARLRLRLSFASPDDDGPMRTIVRRLASEWDEYGATWNGEPEWASIRDSTFVGTTPQWYEWEIPDLVQGWADGAFPNYGLELIGDETVRQRERVFYARETNTDFFPQLVVDYEVVDDQSPPAITVEALPAYVGRSFVVGWRGEDIGGAGIAYYDVQYRVNGGDWVEWQVGVTHGAEEFTNGQNGQRYEFRARGVDQVGNVEPFGDPEASTVVDTGPPVSVVAPLPSLTKATTFIVRWSGDDRGGSDIQYYDVRYRINEEPWQLWQAQTLATEASFRPTGDGLYEFEVRAVDNAGRVEPFTNQPDTGTIVDNKAPFIVPRVYLPLMGGG